MAKRIVIFGWAESVHIQRWAAGLQARGYDLKVISLGGDPLVEIPTTIFPRTGRLAYARYAKAAAQAAREFDPDLVHVHYAAGFGHWGIRTGHTPLVVSVWGSDIERIARRWPFSWLVQRALDKATAITASSEYLRRQAVRLSPACADKCHIIPFGVPIPDEGLPMPGIPPVRLCYLKLHSRIYAPDLVIEAVAKAVGHGHDMTLSLAGSGDMTEELRLQADRLGLSDRISFPGFIPNRDAYSFLQRHHVLVMPSRQEAFGVAALEAAACGRPTIGSVAGGIPEVIADGQSGLLVPVDDIEALTNAIERLARDPDLIAILGRQARNRVEQEFSWEKSLDDMSELYERLIAG